MRRRSGRPAGIVAVLIALAVVFWFRAEPTPVTPVAAPQAGSTEFAPAEARQIAITLRRIESNGPFPYEKDGATFMNREGRLPRQESGWYREYTVPTPGAKNRGARRIVRGRDGKSWYTRDHYRTFVPLDRPGS